MKSAIEACAILMLVALALVLACEDEVLPGGEREADPQPSISLVDVPVFQSARNVALGEFPGNPSTRERLREAIAGKKIWTVVERTGQADVVLEDDGDGHLRLRTADTDHLLWRSSLVMKDADAARIDAVVDEFLAAVDRR